MSDTWYRDPVQLPPFEDGFGKLWTFDGRCLNPDPRTMPYTTLCGGWPGIVADRPHPPPLELTWADVEEMIRRFPPFPGCPVEGHKGCDLYNCRWDPEYTGP